MSLSEAELDQEDATAPDDLAAVDYSKIPFIPRRWGWAGYLPYGSVSLWTAAGETGKGMLFCAVAARVVLGLPFPDEDQAVRRAPQRLVWVTGPGEDDQFEDMAPRLQAALAAAAAEFGLDPGHAQQALSLIHDLSEWRDGTPVSLPADCPRVLAEIKRLNAAAGKPPVAMVVADSLSALLSDGYTIDSRQGARRTMAMLNRFARKADIVFAVIHHLTKDGKVAGSPAVLDSVRLAFKIVRSKEDDSVRLITRHKANISNAVPVRYIITGKGPSVHAEFVGAGDQRAERIDQAREHASPEPAEGSIRARMADQASADPGPFRVLRRVRSPGQAQPDGAWLPGSFDQRDAACKAAEGDAAQVLAWQRDPKTPGFYIAAFRRPDGADVAYGVKRKV
jgi:hypothetical protein